MDQIVKWVEKMPHNLRAVAKACRVYPPDLLAWYAAGQDLECADRHMVQLAWEIDRIRAERAAENYARIVAAANGGEKRKTVTRPNGDVEETVEDVLPQAWAIERLDALQEASPWEICPTGDQADELHKLMKELAPTPMLPAASNGECDRSFALQHGPHGGCNATTPGSLSRSVSVDGATIVRDEMDSEAAEKGGVSIGDGANFDVHTQSLTESE